MKSKIKVCIQSILFLLIFCMLFFYVQNVFAATTRGDGILAHFLNGFEALEPDSVDVVFIGSSHVYCGVEPMELYRDQQICAYNLSSGSQYMEGSYFMAKYAFEKQSPKVVFLDMASIFARKNTDGAYSKDTAFRILMDMMPDHKIRSEMAKEYSDFSYGDGYLTALFPIIKYHSGWQNIKKLTFDKIDQPFCLAGAWPYSRTIGSGVTVDDVEDIILNMKERDEGNLDYYLNGALNEKTIDGLNYNVYIDETALTYFLKIKTLCEENNAQLIPFKVPTLGFPQNDGGWSKDKSEQIRELTEKYQLPYYDLMYDYPGTVDFSTDSWDGGTHLNFKGALKVTAALENILNDLGQFGGKRNNVYDKMLPDYLKIYDVLMLEMEKDFNNYINMLSEHSDKWNVYITTSQEYTRSMTEEDYEFLKNALGLQMIADGEYADTYAAIIAGGTILYEATSNRHIEYSMKVDDLSVYLYSASWYDGINGSIKIGGTEYSGKTRGLNIVVFDKESSLVIDSVAFDTYQTEKPIARNDDLVNSYKTAYLWSVCDK